MTKVKTVIVLGAPKCGTTHVAKLFDSSRNFEVVKIHPQNIESGDQILRTTDLNYKFAKTPRWIFRRLEMSEIVKHVEESTTDSVLFCVFYRNYSEYLASLYHQRRVEFPEKYQHLKIEEFINCESLETLNALDVSGATYGDNIMSLHGNIRFFQRLIQDINRFELVLMDRKIFENMSLMEIFNNLNVDIDNREYSFQPFESRTSKIKYKVDSKFTDAYWTLKEDKDLPHFKTRMI